MARTYDSNARKYELISSEIKGRGVYRFIHIAKDAYVQDVTSVREKKGEKVGKHSLQ